MGIYSMWLACGNRYLPRGSKRKCTFYYYCWQRICFQIGNTVVNISFLGNLTHMPLPSVNKAAHSGFEIQKRHHQKSKTRDISGPTKRGYVLQNKILKRGGGDFVMIHWIQWNSFRENSSDLVSHHNAPNTNRPAAWSIQLQTSVISGYYTR